MLGIMLDVKTAESIENVLPSLEEEVVPYLMRKKKIASRQPLSSCLMARKGDGVRFLNGHIGFFLCLCSWPLNISVIPMVPPPLPSPHKSVFGKSSESQESK